MPSFQSCSLCNCDITASNCMNSCWWMLMLRLLNWTRPSKVSSVMVIVSTQNMIADGLHRVLRQGTCWFWMLLLSHLMKYNCWRHLCRSVRKLGTQGRYHLILMDSRQPIIEYEHRHLIFFRETAKGKMKKNALCNYGYEMPHGEIAAFHLHRYEIPRYLTRLTSKTHPKLSRVKYIFGKAYVLCLLMAWRRYALGHLHGDQV